MYLHQFSLTTGQIFAVFGSLQSASILIGATIYNNLYPATLHFWVGFCFVVGASVAVFPIGLMLYVELVLLPISLL